jgi:hypothetical protein
MAAAQCIERRRIAAELHRLTVALFWACERVRDEKLKHGPNDEESCEADVGLSPHGKHLAVLALEEKLAKCREMTVARGCSPEESETAARLADELEKRLDETKLSSRETIPGMNIETIRAKQYRTNQE